MEEEWFKDTYLNKTIEDINYVNISYEWKKRNMNDDDSSFHHKKEVESFLISWKIKKPIT